MAVNVLIVGGGVGGLCLAQGLHRAGVAVRVFERDASAFTRGREQLLRIDEHGVSALGRCVSDDLYRLFRATTNPAYTSRLMAFDRFLRPATSWADPNGADPARASTLVNRRTLRELLVAGLGDVVEFGREVVAVHDNGDDARVEFADGQSATGDIVVAADGLDSVVRRQVLPHAESVDTGLRAIYGQAIFDRHLQSALPDALYGGSSPVLGQHGISLNVGVFRPTQSPQRAAALIAPYARLSHVPNYVKWTLVVPAENLAGVVDLHALVTQLTEDWHPALTELIRCSDPPSTFALTVRAALPVDPWPTGRVTLIGDAVHAPTPVAGTGANVALQDAAALAERLIAADRGRLEPLPAIADYEATMPTHGFQGRQPALV